MMLYPKAREFVISHIEEKAKKAIREKWNPNEYDLSVREYLDSIEEVNNGLQCPYLIPSMQAKKNAYLDLYYIAVDIYATWRLAQDMLDHLERGVTHEP